jgi:hypothetical protein
MLNLGKGELGFGDSACRWRRRSWTLGRISKLDYLLVNQFGTIPGFQLGMIEFINHPGFLGVCSLA